MSGKRRQDKHSRTNATSRGRFRLRRPTLQDLLPSPAFAAIVGVVVLAFVGVGLYAAIGEPSVRSDRLQLQRQVTLYGSDEFSDPANVPLNPKWWNVETGDGLPNAADDPRPEYSGTLQTFTSDPRNVRFDGEGHMIIEARRDGDRITSARVSTRTRLNFQRGMIQVRMKMPKGQGVQGAFSMLGLSAVELGYPDAGEITVARNTDGDNVIHAGVVGPWISKSPRPVDHWSLTSATGLEPNPSDDFHIYWIRKDREYITIGVDDHIFGYFRKIDVPDGGKWVQDPPFFVVLDVTAGGASGTPAADALPAQMTIDWVRVYG
jgi:beta-glucanase (GH16 family)